MHEKLSSDRFNYFFYYRAVTEIKFHMNILSLQEGIVLQHVVHQKRYNAIIIRHKDEHFLIIIKTQANLYQRKCNILPKLLIVETSYRCIHYICYLKCVLL